MPATIASGDFVAESIDADMGGCVCVCVCDGCMYEYDGIASSWVPFVSEVFENSQHIHHFSLPIYIITPYVLHWPKVYQSTL